VATTFTLVTDCAVDAAALFDAARDIGLHVESMRGSRERAVGGVTAGRIGPGEHVTWRARHFGIRFTMTSRITAFDRPRRFVDEQEAGPFRSFVHEHAFEEVPGGCRMVDTITVASPILGVAAERLVLVPYLRRLIRRRNAVLARAASS